jgi:hypothetical protein
LEEIKSHVHDAYERELSSGKDPHEALEIAIRKIGELNSVAESFGKIYPPVYRRPIFWSGVSFLAILIGLPVSLVVFSREWDRRNEARESLIDQKLESMISDQAPFAEALRPDPKRVVAGKDFGRFANFRIRWGDSPSRPPPEKALERIRQAGKKWLSLSDEPSIFSGVSTEWMKDLETYDYWEIFKSSPSEKELSEDPVRGFSLSLPDYTHLVDLARIRYLQGIKNEIFSPRSAK